MVEDLPVPGGPITRLWSAVVNDLRTASGQNDSAISTGACFLISNSFIFNVLRLTIVATTSHNTACNPVSDLCNVLKGNLRKLIDASGIFDKGTEYICHHWSDH